MGVLQRILGKRPASSPAPAWPVCASCKMPLTPRLPDEIARFNAAHGIELPIQQKQIPFDGTLPRGVRLYEGTECAACGQIYCIDCHDFESKGPKCPGCGVWQLRPVLRREA